MKKIIKQFVPVTAMVLACLMLVACGPKATEEPVTESLEATAYKVVIEADDTKVIVENAGEKTIEQLLDEAEIVVRVI